MLTWFAQELSSSCVSACVRIVLTAFGVTASEEQVRQLLRHDKLGLSLAAAQAQLAQAGTAAFFHDDWSLADLRDALRRGYYPIVGVERHLLGYPPASHAVVLTGLSSKGVEILDPMNGPQVRTFGLPAFEQAWALADREALVIQTPPLKLSAAGNALTNSP
jgi:ABC-type bacteriocin/lantibiotic exporter with double-glycine peptidase domain